jgi:hypothetical protein
VAAKAILDADEPKKPEELTGVDLLAHVESIKTDRDKLVDFLTGIGETKTRFVAASRKNDPDIFPATTDALKRLREIESGQNGQDLPWYRTIGPSLGGLGKFIVISIAVIVFIFGNLLYTIFAAIAAIALTAQVLVPKFWPEKFKDEQKKLLLTVGTWGIFVLCVIVMAFAGRNDIVNSLFGGRESIPSQIHQGQDGGHQTTTPGTAQGTVTNPTFENILRNAGGSAVARPISDFGIFPGVSLRVFPMAVGNGNIPIGNSGFDTQLRAENMVAVDGAPNAQIVFFMENASINQDGSLDVYWLAADGTTGTGFMRLVD